MLHSSVRGSGPDLVLVHGWGMNGTVWEPLAAALAHRYRVLVPDLPGHGQSPYQSHRSRLVDWADECLEAAPAIAVWMGWSLGGSVVLEAALRAPQKVRALVLVAATPRFIQGPGWPHAMPVETLAQFRDALVKDPAATLDRFLSLQARGDEDARNLLRTLRGRLVQQPAADAAALDAGLGLLRNTDLRGHLPALRQPSLWLFGRRDTLVPWRCSEALSGLLPAARAEVIRGAAHAPFLSHLDASMIPLRRFLETLA